MRWRRDTLAVTDRGHGLHMKTDTELDCPWCADTMVSIDAIDRGAGDSFACPTCSIVDELAPDPVSVPIALAA